MSLANAKSKRPVWLEQREGKSSVRRAEGRSPLQVRILAHKTRQLVFELYARDSMRKAHEKKPGMSLPSASIKLIIGHNFCKEWSKAALFQTITYPL